MDNCAELKGFSAADAKGEVLEADEREKADLAEALLRSEKDAIDRENADIVEAILRSTAEFCQQNAIVHLVMNIMTSEAANVLMHSPALAECRARVELAGYEVMPEWAHGAMIFVPMTAEEATEFGLTLQTNSIVAFQRDEHRVLQALEELSRRSRPRIRQWPVQFQCSGVDGPDTSVHAQPLESRRDDASELCIFIQNTFSCCRVPHTSASDAVTASTTDANARNPLANPRRKLCWTERVTASISHSSDAAVIHADEAARIVALLEHPSNDAPETTDASRVLALWLEGSMVPNGYVAKSASGVTMIMSETANAKYDPSFEGVDSTSLNLNGLRGMVGGPCVRAWPENITFEEHVYLILPVHNKVDKVMRSTTLLDRCDEQGLLCDPWQLVKDPVFDQGHVAIKVDHFCNFVPVWPEDGLHCAVRCIPFWHGGTSRLTVLIFHGVGCDMCAKLSLDHKRALVDTDGYIEARGWASFMFDSTNCHLCIDCVSASSCERKVKLIPGQFPQMADLFLEEGVSAPVVKLWPSHVPDSVTTIPFPSAVKGAHPQSLASTTAYASMSGRGSNDGEGLPSQLPPSSTFYERCMKAQHNPVLLFKGAPVASFACFGYALVEQCFVMMQATLCDSNLRPIYISFADDEPWEFAHVTLMRLKNGVYKQCNGQVLWSSNDDMPFDISGVLQAVNAEWCQNGVFTKLFRVVYDIDWHGKRYNIVGGDAFDWIREAQEELKGRFSASALELELWGQESDGCAPHITFQRKR